MTVLGIVTKGREDQAYFVQTFKVEYVDANNNDAVTTALGVSDSSTFIGNSDQATPVYNMFKKPAKSGNFTITPLTFSGKVGMRIGLIVQGTSCADRGGACVGLGPVEPTCACEAGKGSLWNASAALSTAPSWTLSLANGFTFALWVKTSVSTADEVKPMLQCIQNQASAADKTTYADKIGFAYYLKQAGGLAVFERHNVGGRAILTEDRGASHNYAATWEHFAFSVTLGPPETKNAYSAVSNSTIKFYRNGKFTSESTFDFYANKDYTDWGCILAPTSSMFSSGMSDIARADVLVGGVVGAVGATQFEGSLQSEFFWNGVVSESEIKNTMTSGFPRHTSSAVAVYAMPLNLSKEAGGTCELIDECKMGNNDCGFGTFCMDETVGFSCQCLTGFYKASGETVTCTDFDECTISSGGTRNNCHKDANCSNVDGGFNCTCRSGKVGNGTFCSDVTYPTLSASTLSSASCPSTKRDNVDYCEVYNVIPPPAPPLFPGHFHFSRFWCNVVIFSLRSLSFSLLPLFCLPPLLGVLLAFPSLTWTFYSQSHLVPPHPRATCAPGQVLGIHQQGLFVQ